MLLRIFDRIDLDQRIFRFIRIFLQVDDPVVVYEEHLIRVFLARFLRLLLGGQLLGHFGDRLALRLVYFRRRFPFAVHIDERVRILDVV